MPDAESRMTVVRLSPDTRAALSQYADVNSMSVSEAARELIAAYVSGEETPGRERLTERQALWIPQDFVPTMHAFAAKAKRERLSQSAALDYIIATET